MSQPLSDDDTLTRNNKDKPQPLKRALSFPFDISFNELEKLATEVLQEVQQPENIPSLVPSQSLPSQISDLEDMEDIQTTRKRRFVELPEDTQQPPQKKRRILTRARAAKYTHLSDLINCGILEVGETISLKGQTGVVCREGWIEYGDTRYPGAWTWCNAIKQQNTDVSLSIPMNDSLNTQSEEQLGWNNTIIESRGAPLNKYKTLFEREEEFRQRLQTHRFKLLQQKRILHRRREKERLGLSQSQIDEELLDLQPPSPLPSNIDGYLYDSMEESLSDAEDDFTPNISPSKRKSKKPKRKSSPRKKKTNEPARDYTKWTPIVTEFGTTRKTSADEEQTNANEQQQSTIHVTGQQIVEMEPITVPDSDDFFSIPESSHVENESSLNSLVQNLIHLADGTEPQDLNLQESEMPDLPAPSPIRGTPPNQLISEEEEQNNQKQSQEWIARRRSPSASPAKKKSQTNTSSSPVASSPVSSGTSSTHHSSSDVSSSPIASASPQKSSKLSRPSPSPISRTQVIVEIPDSSEDILLPDSLLERTQIIPSNENISSPIRNYPHSPRPQLVQEENEDVVGVEHMEDICSLDVSEVNDIEILADSEASVGESAGIKSFSAPESSAEAQYESHEVMQAPSQPVPIQHQSEQQKQQLAQPITSLSEKWNKRKQYQRQLQQKAKKSSLVPSPSSSAPQSIPNDQNMAPIMNEDPTTSQTVPCVSQGSPLPENLLDSPPVEITGFKTLAEQWKDRKQTNSQDSVSSISPVTSQSSPITIDEEIAQLEELERCEARKQAEQRQLEQNQRAKAAIAEQQRIDEQKKQKQIAEEKIAREKQIQAAKVQQRKEEEKRKKIAQDARAQRIAEQEALLQQKLRDQEKRKQQELEAEQFQLKLAQQKLEREALEQLKKQELERAASLKKQLEEEKLTARRNAEREQQELARAAALKKQQQEKEKLTARRNAEEQRKLRERKENEARKQQELAHTAEISRKHAAQKKQQEKQANEVVASPSRGSFIVSRGVDSVVQLCHQKQRELEVDDHVSPVSSQIEETLKKQQEQEIQQQEEERKIQESELSQKLDEILVSSSVSSLGSLEVLNDSPSSLDKIPVRQHAPQGRRTVSGEICVNYSNNASDWYHSTSQPSLELSQESIPRKQEKKERDSNGDSPMEDIEDIIDSPRVVTPRGASQPVILASGLSSVMLQRIHMLVQELGGTLVTRFADNVTHLVVLTSGKNSQCTRRTLKYSQAVLAGIWVVNYDWILSSFHSQHWVDENTFEIIGDNTFAKRTPQRARKANQKGIPRLFDGLKFFFCGKFEAIDKDVLRKLVSSGHGKMYSSLPKAPNTSAEEIANAKKQQWLVVCDGTSFDYEAAKDVYFASGLIPVSYEYLFDCVSQFNILSASRYQILQTQTESFQSQCSQAF